VTAQVTKNKPQVGARTPRVQKEKSDKKNEKGLKRNKKENNTTDEYIIHTYICIVTRIDYEKGNYSIVFLLVFSSLGIFRLWFTLPILYPSLTSPFARCTLENL
jgi:hypothetical protein